MPNEPITCCTSLPARPEALAMAMRPTVFCPSHRVEVCVARSIEAQRTAGNV